MHTKLVLAGLLATFGTGVLAQGYGNRGFDAPSRMEQLRQDSQAGSKTWHTEGKGHGNGFGQGHGSGRPDDVPGKGLATAPGQQNKSSEPGIAPLITSGVSAGITGVEPYFVNTGIPVTVVVRGTGLTGLLAKFNGLEFPVTVSTDSSLSVALPANSGLQGAGTLELVDPLTGNVRLLESAVKFVAGTVSEAVAGGYAHRNVGFLNKLGQSLGYDMYEPVGYSTRTVASPVIVLAHGDNWIQGTKGDPVVAQLATAFVSAGYLVAVPDYRKAPNVPYPGGYQDMVALIKALRAEPASYRIDPSRIAVVGYKAGGQLATLAGVERLRSGTFLSSCVVSLNGIYDLRSGLSGDALLAVSQYVPDSDRAKLTDASPVHFIREGLSTRILAIQGAGNSFVSQDQYRAFVTKAKIAKVPVTELVVQGQGTEFSQAGIASVYPQIQQFINTCW